MVKSGVKSKQSWRGVERGILGLNACRARIGWNIGTKCRTAGAAHHQHVSYVCCYNIDAVSIVDNNILADIMIFERSKDRIME